MKNDEKNDAASSQHSEACFSRRALLGGSATLAAATVFTSEARATRAVAGKPVYVQIFLRGAMDGLTTVVPYGDPDLYFWRPTLAVPPPGSIGGALNLDGFFGLAPAAAPLLTPWSDGRLAIMHAAGSIDPSRSHFEAQARMEVADPSLPLGVITDGWLARYLIQSAGGATASLRAVGASPLLPYTLRGAPKALPIPDFENFLFPGRAVSALQRLTALSEAYALRPAPVGTSALDTIASFGLGGIDFAAYSPENGAVYPDSVLGQRLRNVAALIKGDIGVEAVTMDVDGWDLHADLGPINGHMANLLDGLTTAIEAFYLDMLGRVDDYVLVCMSEFGRHVKENSSRGLDHGHGNAMFVMGGHVNGGQVYANWPGLSDVDLDQGDVAITTDYRDIIGEILTDRFGVTNLAPIFPLHTFTNYGVIS